MAISNRATLLTGTVKVLKKYYTPVAPATDRPLIEHLLCRLLPGKQYADRRAQRVHRARTAVFRLERSAGQLSIRELAEVMKPLSDPEDAAASRAECPAERL